jgi:hypothetical protein
MRFAILLLPLLLACGSDGPAAPDPSRPIPPAAIWTVRDSVGGGVVPVRHTMTAAAGVDGVVLRVRCADYYEAGARSVSVEIEEGPATAFGSPPLVVAHVEPSGATVGGWTQSHLPYRITLFDEPAAAFVTSVSGSRVFRAWYSVGGAVRYRAWDVSGAGPALQQVQSASS